MQMTKKVLSIVLAVMMVVFMMVVGAVSASAAGTGAVEYTTLAGATSTTTSMSQLKDGTYKLLEDHTETTRMAYNLFAYDVTIDLNGHTFTSTATDCAITMGRSGSSSNHRKLTIIDSVGGGKFVNNSVSASDSSDAIIKVDNKYNEVTIDAAIEGTACGVALFGDNQTLNVTGGSITVNGADFAIATNGANTNNPTINISGGDITSTGATAIYQPANGTLNISGGTITGKTGVYVKSGTTNITGGTIKGTGADTGYSYNGNGANSTGDAIVVDNCGYPGGVPVVNVQGGTFESDNADAVGSYSNGASNSPVEGFIEGGDFVGGVDAAYVAPTATKATIDGVEYVGYDGVINDQASLAAACANGGKYVVGESFATTGATVAGGKNLEINFADKTITVSTPWTFANKGTLTVDGTTGGLEGEKGLVDNYGTFNVKGGVYTTSLTNPAFYNNKDGNVINVSGGTINAAGTAIVNNNGTTNISGGTINGSVINNEDELTTETAPDAINFTGGTINGVVVVDDVDGTFTMSDNAVIAYDGANNAVEITAGTANLNGGTINCENGACGVFIVGDDSKLVVDGATINTEDSFCVSSNGSSGKDYEGYEIEIKSGSLTSTGASAIYQQQEGKLTITGGDITGKTAVYIKAGDISITGGTFTSTKQPGEPYSYNGNGCNATGDAIVVENAGSAYKPITSIEITGGTFTTTDPAMDAVVTYAKDDGAPTQTEFISGGSFSSPVPEEFCADTFVPAPKDPATGMYTVVVDDNPLDPFKITAADACAEDNNAFGLTSDYLKGTILGVQIKSKTEVDAPVTSETQDEKGKQNMRFIAVIDRALIANATDYGFVLAKVGGKNYGEFDMTKVTKDWGNGEKKISAKGTYNNVCGDPRYGEPDDTTTDYKYVTCAVNDVDDTAKVLVRFYYTDAQGNTYYAKYAGRNYAYTGCIAGFVSGAVVG